MPGVTLDIADAAELTEMLFFLGLTRDRRLGTVLADYVGQPAHGIQDLR